MFTLSVIRTTVK